MADYNGDLSKVITLQAELIKKIDKMDGKLDTVCDTVIRHEENIKSERKILNEVKLKQEKNDLITKWIGGLSAFFGMLWTLALIYLGFKEG